MSRGVQHSGSVKPFSLGAFDGWAPFSASCVEPLAAGAHFRRYPSCCCSILLYPSAIRCGMAGHNPTQATRPSPPARSCRGKGRTIATARSVVRSFHHRERVGLSSLGEARASDSATFSNAPGGVFFVLAVFKLSVLRDRQQTPVLLC